jgi:hypothetical protein
MLDKILRVLRGPSAPAVVLQPQGGQPAKAAILDQYIRTMPSPQNALDLFKGEWWSSFPAGGAPLQAGATPLFDDGRIRFAVDNFGGVKDLSILELGPLEGGHTYMLEKAGAREIVAVEANARAFLKCLIAKEVLGLEASHFVLGDFEEYLRNPPKRFDAAIACGVIYHLRNPVELILNLAKVTDRVYVWTQYYIAERLAAIPHMKHRFRHSEAAEVGGFRHTLHRYEYGDFLDTTRFAGGSDDYSSWLSKDDLLGAFRHAGFTGITVGEDDLQHANGPCISFVARKP